MKFLDYWLKSVPPPGGERVYIRDNLGTVPSTSEYCRVGSQEGWLIYESYFEDSYKTVHHTYRLNGGPRMSTPKKVVPRPAAVKNKPKKPLHIRHWE